MTRWYILFHNRKAIARTTSLSAVFAASRCNLNGATPQACNLMNKTAWAVFAIVQHLIIRADWQSAVAYLFEKQCLLPIVKQMAKFIWLLLGQPLG